MASDMAKFRVHFTGGEGINWALDHDIQHLTRLSAGFVEVVPLEKAEIVHTVFWHALLQLPRKQLLGKRVIASLADKPQIVFSRPEYLKVRELFDVWLCEYHESLRFVSNCGLPCMLFPDPLDLRQFVPPPDRAASRAALEGPAGDPAGALPDRQLPPGRVRRRLDAAQEAEGRPTCSWRSPPCSTAGCAGSLPAGGAAPPLDPPGFQGARHSLYVPWRGVPGGRLAGEHAESRRDREAVPGLDAYLITSRWEGAPNSVLECAATKTCVISTRVGQSPDILTRGQIFDDAAAGAELLMRDVRERHLAATLESAYEHVRKFNSDEAIAGRLKYIYEQTRLNASPSARADRRFPRRAGRRPVRPAPGRRPPRTAHSARRRSCGVSPGRSSSPSRCGTSSSRPDTAAAPVHDRARGCFAAEGNAGRPEFRRGRGRPRHPIHLVRPEAFGASVSPARWSSTGSMGRSSCTGQ